MELDTPKTLDPSALILTHRSKKIIPIHGVDKVTSLKKKLLLSNIKVKAQARKIRQQCVYIQILKNKIAAKSDSAKLRPVDTNFRQSTPTPNLGQLFSQGQMQILMGEKKHKHWTSEEMAKAIAFQSLSSKAYCYIRNICKFPFPGLSTIQRWLHEMDFRPGILTPIFQILTEVGKSTPMYRTAILGFDEVEISDSFCYDVDEDKVYGGKSKMLSVCLRGLFSGWKQVVYYDFDENIEKSKILNIITRAEEVGIRVVGMVNDMCTLNMRLWRELGITITNQHFENPVSQNKIWVFADFPHLLKLLRNHLLDQGFTLQDGTKIDKPVLERLLRSTNDDLRICHKITAKHINVEKKQRQRVRPAFQVFSHSVAKAISYLELASPKVSQFFQLVNDFSDTMNSGFCQNSVNPYKNPFGMNVNEQRGILLQMLTIMETMTVGTPPKTRKPALKPFQKGFIISINSLLGLFEDMKQSPVNASYILTRRLGQDYIESSFSNFRGFGGPNINPDAVSAKNRMKRLSVSWNFLPSRNEAVERTDTCGYISADMVHQLCKPKHKSKPQVETAAENDFPPIDTSEDEATLYPTRGLKSLEGGREMVAGFIADKLLEEYPGLSLNWTDKCSQNSGWLRHVSRGGLTEPSTVWFKTFRLFDKHFENFHPTYNDIDRTPGVVRRLSKFLQENYPDVPEEAVELFAKTRTMIRISSINRRISEEKIRIKNLRRCAYKDKEDNSALPVEMEDEFDLNFLEL